MEYEETLEDDGVFHVQVNNIDTYQSFPTTLDRAFNPSTGQKFFNLPIIRLYSSTPTGRNVLIHIHGVYPYFYIEYKGDISDGMSTFLKSICLDQLSNCLYRALQSKNISPL
jgi:DNA polymerase zeta